ncbi:25S rRNA (uridine-N(3))-methyltransferase [Ceratobasidium sp. AG-Ba]|nr:25S rRNA (uridine-N(3))-methyltransferase [Ceratobasidium sp. AG-Ba]
MGNSKRTKSLKESLIGHQKRQAENAAAAKKQAALKDKGKSKGRKGPQEKRFIIPLSALDRILLIGEGNFSFAHSLLQHPSLPHLPPSNITATAYDTEDERLKKARGVVVELNARRGNKGKEKDKDKIEFSDEDEEEESKGGPVGPKRAGSVLVTLREQEPYTLWLIFPLLLRVFVNQFRTGIFHGSQRTQ